jgi:nicotinic acetylcholine receptor, invertebrate
MFHFISYFCGNLIKLLLFFQVKIVFLCWLPCILRMDRPGRDISMDYPTTPTSDTSDRKAHLNDVELKER